MKKLILATLLAAGAIAPALADTVYFSSNFSDLSAFTPKPGYSLAYTTGNTLTFSSGNSAGDIFTTATFTGGYINFDYRGVSGVDGGGYVGISSDLPGSHVWLAGTSTTYWTPVSMVNDNTWHHYSIAFNGADVGGNAHIMLEQFATNTPNQAYFANLSVSSAPLAVPEPGSYAMFAAGLGLLSFALRRKA